MKTILLISSFVSSSQVGANISAFALRRLGIEVVILPTTLFGRHPGWGTPGGTKTDPKTLQDMWEGINAQNIHFDAVMTGYMADRAHISLAAEIIETLRQDNPAIKILVDPVKGDAGRLYIPERRARLLNTNLSPMADILTPNLYELSYMFGRDFHDIEEIINAVRQTSQTMLVTSVTRGDQIGALYIDADQANYVGHETFDTVPNGGGDMLAALFLAHLLKGADPNEAQIQAVSATYAILSKAVEMHLPELPITAYQDDLITPPRLELEPITL